MRIRPIFAWYDFWIGFFVDKAKRRFYFFPIPCFGLVIEWGAPKQADLTTNSAATLTFTSGRSIELCSDCSEKVVR